MDRQILQTRELGNGVVDTKTFWPFIAVKNGQVVRLSSDGLFDLSNVKALKFPAARFPFLLHFYVASAGTDVYETKAIYIEAGRTEIEINEPIVAYVEASLIVKENQ